MRSILLQLANVVVLLVTFPSGVAIAADVAARRPNILLILADDVGREVLSCYGGQSYQTPRLDQLAADGLRFTQAHVMPACHPTRVCLLTGQYPFRLGNPKWGTFPKEAEQRTFASLLREAGYATAVAGKWQLTMLKDDLDHPHLLGFDEYCLFGWHEGPRYYQPHIWQNGQLREDVRDRYGPDVYCEFLIDFMRRCGDRPFLAFYSMALCHDVTDDLDEPVPVGPHGRYENYREMVQSMDDRVGRMVDAIDELAISDNTMVLFVGDNGTAAKTIVSVRDGQLVSETNTSEFEGRSIPGGKATLTDWGTRVPLIASWPGTISAGAVSESLVDASDFLPTLVEVAGADMPSTSKIDGCSFAGELSRRDTSPREWVFAERKGKSFVKDHRWKLNNDGRLFDLVADVDEKRPLSREELSPDADAARRRLGAILESLGASALP